MVRLGSAEVYVFETDASTWRMEQGSDGRYLLEVDDTLYRVIEYDTHNRGNEVVPRFLVERLPEGRRGRLDKSEVR